MLDDYDCKRPDGKYDYFLDIYAHPHNGVNDVATLVNNFITENNLQSADLADQIIGLVNKLKGGLAAMDKRQIIGLNGHLCFYDNQRVIKWLFVCVQRNCDPLYTPPEY